MILEIDLGTGFKPVACLLSFTEDESTEVLGTTTRKNLRWRTSVGHYQTKTISGNGLFVEEAGLISYNQLREILWAGTRFEWRIGDDDGFGFLRSLDLGVPEGDDVNFSFSIQVDGNPALIDIITVTVATPVPDSVAPGGGPVDFIVTYTNADAITLASGDITLLTSGTATAGTIQVIDNGPESKIVRLSNISGIGTIGFSVPSGSATNTSGGTAPAFTSGDVLAVQAPLPSGYTVEWFEPPYNDTNCAFASFTVIKPGGFPPNSTFSFTIESSGGGTPISQGPFPISAQSSVTQRNICALPDGIITVSVTVTDPNGIGPTVQDTANKSTPPPAPSGYAIAFADDPIQNPNTTLNLTAGNGEATNYSYAIITVPTSGSPVTGSGTVTGTPQSIPIDVTSLANGTLQVNFTVSNTGGNEVLTDQTTKSV